MCKVKIYITASILIIALGISLLAYMIIVEDEPSPIPPLMILSGVIFYFLTSKKAY